VIGGVLDWTAPRINHPGVATLDATVGVLAIASHNVKVEK